MEGASVLDPNPVRFAYGPCRLPLICAQLLLRLVRGTGFGEPRPAAFEVEPACGSASSGARSSAGGEISPAPPAGGPPLPPGSALFRGLLVEALSPARAGLQPFLHRLFNVATWANSDFAATGAAGGFRGR